MTLGGAGRGGFLDLDDAEAVVLAAGRGAAAVLCDASVDAGRGLAGSAEEAGGAAGRA